MHNFLAFYNHKIRTYNDGSAYISNLILSLSHLSPLTTVIVDSIDAYGPNTDSDSSDASTPTTIPVLASCKTLEQATALLKHPIPYLLVTPHNTALEILSRFPGRIYDIHVSLRSDKEAPFFDSCRTATARIDWLGVLPLGLAEMGLKARASSTIDTWMSFIEKGLGSPGFYAGKESFESSMYCRGGGRLNIVGRPKRAYASQAPLIAWNPTELLGLVDIRATRRQRKSYFFSIPIGGKLPKNCAALPDSAFYSFIFRRFGARSDSWRGRDEAWKNAAADYFARAMSDALQSLKDLTSGIRHSQSLEGNERSFLFPDYVGRDCVRGALKSANKPKNIRGRVFGSRVSQGFKPRARCIVSTNIVHFLMKKVIGPAAPRNDVDYYRY